MVSNGSARKKDPSSDVKDMPKRVDMNVVLNEPAEKFNMESPGRDFLGSSQMDLDTISSRYEILSLPNILTKTSSPLLFTLAPRIEPSNTDIGAEKEQERLTEILALQTSKLLLTSTQFQDQLITDTAALLSLESSINKNTDGITRERSRIKQISSTTWATTFMIWGSVVGLAITFLWMVLYMRMFGIVQPRQVTTAVIEAAVDNFDEFEEL